MTSEALVEQASTLEGQPCPHCQQDGSVQAEVVRNWMDHKAVRIIAWCTACTWNIDAGAVDPVPALVYESENGGQAAAASDVNGITVTEHGAGLGYTVEGGHLVSPDLAADAERDLHYIEWPADASQDDGD